VVIGASAGGIQALTELVSKLPADLEASLFVVVHTSPSSPGILPQLLDKAGPLRARFAQHNEGIRPGRIYVAPPDLHLLFREGRMLVTHGPKENGFRPAVDPMFRTAARTFGPRVVGVILSGGLDDGTDGLRIVKECSGVAIAQHPEEATFSSMPASAIRNVQVDHIVRVEAMPALLEKYASEEMPKELHMCPDDGLPDIAEEGDSALMNKAMNGAPSALTCPECGGALWERQHGKQLRFQCHVGHVYTGDGLVSEMDRDLEQALWSAVRVMEEAAELRRRMHRIAAESTWKSFAPPYEEQAQQLERRAAVIRDLLERAARGGNGAKDNGKSSHGKAKNLAEGKAASNRVRKNRTRKTPRPGE
jgi:two-component system chemotaxis response regulator CheB